MQVHHLLNEFERLPKWQLHACEDLGQHFGAYVVVVAECPTYALLKTLGARLADVVEQGRPAQPHVVALCRHSVQHLHGVVEDVFVGEFAALLHSFEGGKLWQYIPQQAYFVKQFPSQRRGCRCLHRLHQLLGYALLRYDLYARGHAFHALECLIANGELQAGGESYSAQHAQRVVRECDVGVEWRADHAVLQVAYAVKGVYKVSVGLWV